VSLAIKTNCPGPSNNPIPKAGPLHQPIRPSRYRSAQIGTLHQTANRSLIALIVLCCDPIAIALTAAASPGDQSRR
jgi:hypothetical protein